jgi:hypothetical protein
MVKVKLHPTIMRMQGKMGGGVFRLSHTGELSFTKLPDMSKVKWSDAQKEHRQRFKEAVRYAKIAMANEEVHAQYVMEAKKLDKRPFDLAVSDYFKGRNLLKQP